jgi:flavodoxin
MKSVVVYASTSGNTRRLAEAIAEALRPRGQVELMAADEAPSTLPAADLVFFGAPTEGHSVSKPMARYLERLTSGSMHGVAAASFDTRFGVTKLLSGSAADGIAKRLRSAGARLAAPPESFLVTRKPELQPGELARAAVWATSVADSIIA